ncbi:MAG: hypothetical protein L0154_27490 [Chloroflexi bacterium]|nr:hypothetical protein [Chloroflexota bacterium]
MSFNPLYNAVQGIQLAQQGRKMEALAYLREAVQREPVNAEVWLWLAHVTPDIHEYQNCIYQALVLSPNHQTARQMQDALMQTNSIPAPQFSGGTSPMNPFVLQSARKRQHRRRVWRRVLILAVIGFLLGGISAIIAIVVMELPTF